MIDEFALHRSRELANGIRYSQDRHDTNFGKQPSSFDLVVDEFYRTSIEINGYLTPKLEAALSNVCQRLKLDRNVVAAFVNNSHEIQAACYYVDEKKCLMRLSSALVNLLEIKEIEFVMGHEIGHFLLKHAPTGVERSSAEFFVFQRAKEISADRIGLVSCGSIQVAGSALVKTASGLTNTHLEINLDKYLLQLEQLSVKSKGENPFKTHPSILLRTYAISEFSSGIPEVNYNSYGAVEVYERDKRIKVFLDEYSDKELHRQISEAKLDLKVWFAAKHISKDQSFTKKEQTIFTNMFGAEMLDKLKNFFASIQMSEIHIEIDKKISEARKKLSGLTPSEARNIEVELAGLVDAKFVET